MIFAAREPRLVATRLGLNSEDQWMRDVANRLDSIYMSKEKLWSTVIAKSGDFEEMFALNISRTGSLAATDCLWYVKYPPSYEAAPQGQNIEYLERNRR